jgi:hypothetical protein
MSAPALPPRPYTQRLASGYRNRCRMSASEAEHYIRCPTCNDWIDMRGLAPVPVMPGPLPLRHGGGELGGSSL